MSSFVWPSNAGGGSVSGVSSLNGLTGDLTLEAGTGIAITPSGSDLIISTTGGGTGTVTSVALADGSTTPIYSISGSPVVSAGTLTFTLNTEPANTFFAGPASGAAAQPTFRTIVNVDLATITTMSALSLSTTQLSGVVQISQGGTGQTVKASAFNALSPMSTQGDLIYEGTGTGTRLAIGTSGQVLTVVAGLPVWVTPSAGTVTAVSVASANGFAGTSSGGTTPALTLNSTLITPVLASNGTALIAATTTGTGSTVVLSASPTLSGTTSVGILVASSTISGTNLTAAGHASADLASINNLTDLSSTAAGFNNISPLTTAGDLIYEVSATDAARLPIGTAGEVLTVVAGLPAWAAPSTPTYLAPTQTVLTGSGTFITPSPAPLYFSVIVVGAGGGGAGSVISGSAVSANNGSAGGNSTFGTLLSALGGGGGNITTSGSGGTGGTASITGPAFGIAFQGGNGESYDNSISSGVAGSGGTNAFGGAGVGGTPGTAGVAGSAATGAGGGGGGGTTGTQTGSAGAAGGWLQANINSPSGSYSFSVGVGGPGGTAGAPGFAGGNGANGTIIVNIYYQ